MQTINTPKASAWQPKVASLLIPVLITILVGILFFASLSIYQLVGSGILLAITVLSVVVGDVKNLPDKDVTILWVATLLYNLYLVSYVL